MLLAAALRERSRRATTDRTIAAENTPARRSADDRQSRAQAGCAGGLGALEERHAKAARYLEPTMCWWMRCVAVESWTRIRVNLRQSRERAARRGTADPDYDPWKRDAKPLRSAAAPKPIVRRRAEARAFVGALEADPRRGAEVALRGEGFFERARFAGREEGPAGRDSEVATAEPAAVTKRPRKRAPTRRPA
jgi:hypothetical protein